MEYSPLIGINGQTIPLHAKLVLLKVGFEDFHIEARWPIKGGPGARVPCFRAYSRASAEAVLADYQERMWMVNRLLDLRRAYRAGWLGGADYQIGVRAVADGLALRCRNPARIRELIGRAELHLPYAVARTKSARYRRQLGQEAA